jgi:hypothetical protein
LQNWNTTYSLERFGPCKNFDERVDKDSNRQIPHTKFREAPLLNKLVDTFTEMLQYLTIDMVWLIFKSKPGSRYQSWHQDFNLHEKITKIIVINLGAVKRSDLLGGLKEDWYPTSFSCHVEDASQTLTQWMSVQAKV